MRSIQRNGRTLLLATGAVLVCSCSGSTDAVRPASLSIVSGESQSGRTGTPVADSLVVMVTGSNGNGFPGATVTWAVASGSATVSPLTSVSGASGQAASAVTLSATAGAVTITATVAGVTPATFHLTSVAACDWREPFAISASVGGLLGSTDCLYPDGSYIDYYGLSVGTQQAARIRLVSNAFDAFLLLTDGSGNPVGADDDDATSTNSDLLIILAPGTYVVGANSYNAGETGAYTLSSATVAETISSCAVWYVTPGVQTSQALASTDCASGSFYADLMAVILRAGRAYTITQNSTAFDAYLYLANNLGNTVASDDDGGGGNNARIVYTPPASGLYIIAAASFLAGETGAYTLAISAPAAAGAAGPGDRAVVKLRPRGARWPVIADIGVPRSPKQVP